ncbi:MAG: HAMP domain-containing sensor histidine kinase [Pseudoruegeria sp.]
MKVKGSIARRLSAALGLSAVTLWLCAVAIAGFVIRHELNEAMDQTMQQSAIRLLPLAAHEVEEMIEEDEFEEEEARLVAGLTEQGANLDYFVTDPNGRIIVFASDAHPDVTELAIQPGFSTLENAPAFALRDPDTGIGIVVVERAGLRSEILSESLMAMLIPLAALIPILIALVYFIVQAAMRPVWKLGEVISERHGRNLSPLEIGPQPRELAPIVQEVESLLSRLKSAMDAERSFAAESAHELRTPIAGALAQVQVLRNALNGRPEQTFAFHAEDALRNLSSLSENLLQSSRLEAGFAVSPTPLDLAPIFQLVLREREFSLHLDRIIVTGLDDGVQAHIVPDAFAIVLRNLLRNALLYAQGNHDITVDFLPDGLMVSNDCAPFDPDLLSRLSHRFVRGNETKRGSGLGLAIATGIIEDCNGQLNFISPIPGQTRGFAARVTFS